MTDEIKKEINVIAVLVVDGVVVSAAIGPNAHGLLMNSVELVHKETDESVNASVLCFMPASAKSGTVMIAHPDVPPISFDYHPEMEQEKERKNIN